MTIEIKSLYDSVLFTHTCDNNTVLKTVTEAIKNDANLRYADFRYADFRNADFSNANLRNADFRNANLRNANLRGADFCYADFRNADFRLANLCNANLRYADFSNADFSDTNLRGAKFSIKIYSIDRVGSSNRRTTYDATNNIIWCGCFTGTIEDFEAKVKETHKNNEEHLHNYMMVIGYFKSLK